jgi:hypothetical protein
MGAVVRENKIIRQQGVREQMEWSGAGSSEAERELREREEAFNVKILTECSCGYAVGYYDINKDCYVLTNVL